MSPLKLETYDSLPSLFFEDDHAEKAKVVNIFLDIVFYRLLLYQHVFILLQLCIDYSSA